MKSKYYRRHGLQQAAEITVVISTNKEVLVQVLAYSSSKTGPQGEYGQGAEDPPALCVYSYLVLLLVPVEWRRGFLCRPKTFFGVVYWYKGQTDSNHHI